MARRASKTWYWPLGLVGYGSEIRDSFPEEAELLGVMTILWNQHENHLGHIFSIVLGAKSEGYAEALWNLQPTHKARRDMLALALEHANLTPNQRGLLDHVIEKTKTAADRRNDLIHGEYVVHGRTAQLFAKIQSPRSAKAPRYQKNTVKDLTRAIRELEQLMQITAALRVDLMPADLVASVREFAKTFREKPVSPSPEDPQTD